MKILGIMLMLLMFAGCENKDSKAKQTDKESILNVAISSDYPPFIYGTDGKLEGFEIELINTIAKKLGKTVHFHNIDFHGIIKTVAKKQVDCAIAAIGKTEERDKDVDFTTPYHRSMTVIVTPIGSGINTVEDLNGNAIGFETGTTYEKYFEDNSDKIFNGVNKLQRTKFCELLKALREDKCQAILTGYSEGYEMQSSDPDLKIIPIPDTVVTLSIVMPKGGDLLTQVNSILEEMLKNGEIIKLEAQYFKKVVAED